MTNPSAGTGLGIAPQGAQGSGSAESVLLDLIKRCEVAVVPDRELDARASLWLTATQRRWQRDDGKAITAEMFDADVDYICGRIDGFEYETRDQAIARTLDPPSYTASIDAALTLVPRGYEWSLRATYTGFGGAMEYAAIVAKPAEDDIIRYGATAPLALLTAALKAQKECAEVLSLLGQMQVENSMPGGGYYQHASEMIQITPLPPYQQEPTK